MLQDRLRPRVQAALSRAADDLEVSGLTGWTIDELPRRRDVRQGPHVVEGFPALVDEGGAVAVRVLPSAVDALVAELVDPVQVRDREAYERLRSQVRARLNETVIDVVRQVERVLSLSYDVRSRLTGTVSLPLLPSLTDLQHQLESLVASGFVTQAGAARMHDLQRYLQAMLVRLDKLPDDVSRDRGLQAQVAMAREEYETALADVRPGRRPSPELLEVRWMIEELRVSLFAQTLRTAYPVSVKRIHRAIVAAT
jgi:ATP-dependent helicase HrpA